MENSKGKTLPVKKANYQASATKNEYIKNWK